MLHLRIAVAFLFGLLCTVGCRATTTSPAASPKGNLRALVVGIDRYEVAASPKKSTAQDREFRNLRGAVRDARAIAEILVSRFGFPREEVTLLTDGAATHDAILSKLERLTELSKPGDLTVFYFGGHGSYEVNAASNEPDRRDETLVPADAALGAPDLRDQEIRRLLNRLIDRGALPTVLLDSCYSGSAARSATTTAVPRALLPASTRRMDSGPRGPRPDDRGAIVLSASQDHQLAWEIEGEDGEIHGAFSWALLRALRDARAGEPAAETFERIRARLAVEARFQVPTLGGVEAARDRSLFGQRGSASPRRSVVAVESLEPDGTLMLAGGWIDGLELGSVLTWKSTPPHPEATAQLEVVEILGISRVRARRRVSASPSIPVGALVEITGWRARGTPLGVWIPSWTRGAESLEQFALDLQREAQPRGVEWVVDPLAQSVTSTSVLRYRGDRWELSRASQTSRVPIAEGATAREILAAIPRGERLWVELPIPHEAARFEIGPGTLNDGIAPVDDASRAQFLLVGRWHNQRLEYAWIRPDSGAQQDIADSTPLPLVTPWRALNSQALQSDLFHLRKLHGWLTLDSPAGSAFPYTLRIGSEAERSAHSLLPLQAGKSYRFHLEQKLGFPRERIRPRYLYLFSIDAQGDSTLLFGRGDDLNRLPALGIAPSEAPITFPLGNEDLVEIAPPVGRETYFLLATEQPLANPRALEYRGFRRRGPKGATPLEELLSQTGGTARGFEVVVSAIDWSIERLSATSVLDPRESSENARTSAAGSPP